MTRSGSWAVPRTAFLPARMWPFDENSGTHGCVDRTKDPDGWLAAAEADTPITTQWDDGQHHGPGPGALPTSSCSKPSLVLDMLDALDVGPGMRVLEIGTGTGWNAALLARRVPGGHVTTLEVDPQVAATARGLLAADHGVRVVTTDGARGWAPGAPYDRVIATCGVRAVPWEWVAQTKPGGVLVVPWGTQFTPSDALVRLVTADDGTSASGRLLSLVQFMKLRAHRLEMPLESYFPGEWPHGADETRTDLGRELAEGGSYSEVAFLLGLAVPQCTLAAGRQEDGTVTAWLYGLSDRSWAAVGWRPGEPKGEVYQCGPRRLWDAVEAAWRWWDAHGRPEVSRFGLTVTAGHQQVWLDQPDQVVWTTAVASSR